MCVLAAAAFYGALAVGAGYDVVAAFAGTEDISRFSVVSRRPYAFWVFGSPVAVLVVPGLKNSVQSATYTVLKMTMAGHTYQRLQNHDVDGSTNGTVAKVNRP